jgi:hypothetical protein
MKILIIKKSIFEVSDRSLIDALIFPLILGFDCIDNSSQWNRMNRTFKLPITCEARFPCVSIFFIILSVLFSPPSLNAQVRIEDCDLGPKSTIHVVFGRRKLAKPPATSPLPDVLATSLAEPPEPLAEDVEDALDDEWVDVTGSDPSASGGEFVERLSTNADCSSEDHERGQLTDELTHVAKKKVVSFYVLCSWKPCPGKLRVRCSLCKEGTVFSTSYFRVSFSKQFSFYPCTFWRS